MSNANLQPRSKSEPFGEILNLRSFIEINQIIFENRKKFDKSQDLIVFITQIWESALENESFGSEVSIYNEILTLKNGKTRETEEKNFNKHSEEKIETLEDLILAILEKDKKNRELYELKSAVLRAFVNKRKIPTLSVVNYLLKELQSQNFIVILKKSNFLGQLNVQIFFEASLDIIQLFVLTTGVTFDCDNFEDLFDEIVQLNERKIESNGKNSDICSSLFLKFVTSGILFKAITETELKTILSGNFMDKNVLVAEIVKFVLIRIILDLSESNCNVQEFECATTSDKILSMTRFFSAELEQHGSNFIEKFNLLLFSGDTLNQIEPKTQNDILNDLSRIVDDSLIKKLFKIGYLKKGKTLLSVLKLIIFKRKDVSKIGQELKHREDQQISERISYFKKAMRAELNKKDFGIRPQIAEVFAFFVLKNRLEPKSYSFLKSDVQIYKKFILMFFRKCAIDKYLFNHVQDFLNFFCESENIILIDVLNSLPFISREHPNLYKVYENVHKILCKKNCYRIGYNGSIENLLRIFLLKMPALSYNKNQGLICHAEKLKLENFNSSGIFEHLQDPQSLKSKDIVEVFHYIHRNLKLRPEFKERYLEDIFEFAKTNEYKTADKLIVIILSYLLDDALYNFSGNNGSGYAQSINSKNYSDDGSLAHPQSFPLKHQKGKRSYNFIKIDQYEEEQIQQKKLVRLPMIYSFDFHVAFKKLIERDESYLSIYDRILLTMRFQVPHLYMYIVSLSPYPLFFNFEFLSSLQSHLVISQKIMKFISTFPDSFSRNPEVSDSQSSFFTRGSEYQITSNERERPQFETYYDKIIELNTQMNTIALSHDHLISSSNPVLNEFHTEMTKTDGPCALKSTSHHTNYEFFIDLVYFNLNNSKMIRSALNFLAICIRNNFSYNLLYVLLKIYNILGIHEPIIDEMIEKGLTHVDFTVDCYKKLGNVTSGIYKHFFYTLYNCIGEETVQTHLDYNSVPESKKEFFFNTYYLIETQDIPQRLVYNHHVYKGYILDSKFDLDLYTIIHFDKNIKSSRVKRIETIDPFHIPQIVQLLTRKEYFDEITDLIVDLCTENTNFITEFVFDLRANYQKPNLYVKSGLQIDPRIEKLIDRLFSIPSKQNTEKSVKITDGIDDKFSNISVNDQKQISDKSYDEKSSAPNLQNLIFFDSLTAISAKMMKFKTASKEIQTFELNQLLSEIKIEKDTFSPIDNSRILRIVENSGLPLQSHAKFPYMVTFEVEKNEEIYTSRIIFKAGDDCRQDQLALQIKKVFLDIFTEANLPIFLYPYRVISTGYESGLIEVIPNAVTRHQIGKQNLKLDQYFEKLFGFKESKLHSEATLKFIYSFVGYSLFSYILNLRDRHNANIMINNHGQVIHIDFGFIFDISPGGIPLELSIKITEDVHILLQDDFELFESLMIQGFFALRRRSKEIILIAASFVDSNLPCYTPYSIENLIERFRFDLSDHEVKLFVKDLIQSSIKKIRTYIYDRFQQITNDIAF